MLRMAVCAIVAGSGSKKKSGSVWKDTDFWTYESEIPEAIDPSTPKGKEFIDNIFKLYKLDAKH